MSLIFCSVRPQHLMDLQDDAERREAASAGLLALMDTPPAGPVDNLLDAKAEAKDARQIAARLDKRARQKVQFTDESLQKHHGGDIFSRMALALTVHDAPMWRVRVRVSGINFIILVY